MNSFQLFTATFKSPHLLKEARKKSLWKVLLYLLFLSAVFSLPTVAQVFGILQTFQQDGQKVIKKLPDFTIKDGRIDTQQKDAGFVYQTNSMIFTFDPDGKRDKKAVEADLIGNVVGLAFLQDQFVFALPSNGAASAILGSTTFDISYHDDKMNGFTNKSLADIVNTDSRQALLIKAIAFLVSLYPAFISLLLNLLVATFSANIFSRFRGLTYRFSDNFKIVAYSATVPVILTAILLFFRPGFNDTYIVVLMTLYIYFQATKLPKPDQEVK